MKTNEQFIKDAISVHGNKYDYSKVEYKGNHAKVCIICPTHREFWQQASDHLKGCGCPKCKGENCSKRKFSTKERFIEKARRIHGNKYDYSKVNYNGCYEKVCIICKEHGEFWQTPNVHLTNHGCPHCNSSRLENEIKNLLDENNIKYVYQKRFNWLGKKSLDFYLKEYNIAIECQGIQHFVNKGWNSRDNLKKIQDRDLEKNILCQKNKIDVIYYTNIKLNNYPYEIFKNKEILLEYIKNAKKTL